MVELQQLRHAINGSSEFWKGGEHEKALNILDDAIAAATKENDSVSIRVLSHHAAVLVGSVGNLLLVKHYYEYSLNFNPENAKALYGLARVSAEQGEPDLAKRYALRCREAIVRSTNEMDRRLLELIVKEWPELKD
jgi:hypothetical protein